MRHLIINYIEDNQDNYLNTRLENCSLYLEDEDINEHILRMREDSEFAENLELAAASDFLKINRKYIKTFHFYFIICINYIIHILYLWEFV